ncbi:MAG: hypothetical protein EOM03_18330 [Clostridia bacterium]|nr:hypothetical protein [Clostridia bacterium]
MGGTTMLALNEPEVKAADLKKIYHGCLWAEPSEIIDNPYNPRDLSHPKEVSRLRDLAKSISEYGLWQYPLATRIHGYNGMVILAGHRRVCALKDFLKWPIIPYHPSEWHGLPESFDIRDAMYVLVMDQELNKTHSAAQKAMIAHEMHNNNVAPVGMPASWEDRRRVWEFVDMYPEFKDLILSGGVKGQYAGAPKISEDGKRTSLGWSVVKTAIEKSKGHYDIAVKHLRKYVNCEYAEMRTMRICIAQEAAERLKELG